MTRRLEKKEEELLCSGREGELRWRTSLGGTEGLHQLPKNHSSKSSDLLEHLLEVNPPQLSSPDKPARPV
jgi:hypothetical protein